MGEPTLWDAILGHVRAKTVLLRIYVQGLPVLKQIAEFRYSLETQHATDSPTVK